MTELMNNSNKMILDQQVYEDIKKVNEYIISATQHGPECEGGVVDQVKHPLVSKDEVVLMDLVKYDIPDSVVAFPFIRKDVNGEIYIDIYFYTGRGTKEDIENINFSSRESRRFYYRARSKFEGCDFFDDPGFERFVIKEKQPLTKEGEERFLRYTKKVSKWHFYGRDSMEYNFTRGTELVMPTDRWAEFNEAFNQLYPEKMLSTIEPEYPGIYFENMYYSITSPGTRFHRNIQKEVLYKAGLENIAFYFEQFSGDLGFIGSPEDILGIRLNVLRQINKYSALIYRIKHPKSREQFINLLNKYDKYIGGREFGLYQWFYIESVDMGKRPFSKSVFNRIGEIEKTGGSRSETYNLIQWDELRHLVGKQYYKNRKIFRGEKLKDEVQLLLGLRGMIEYGCDVIDDRILSQKKENARFEYEDENYVVKLPENAKEIIAEAVTMKNCLLDYMSDIADGETVIAFVRKKEQPDTPYIDVEIDCGEISQMYRACNEMLNFEDVKFMEKYAGIIKVEPYDVSEYLDSELELDSDFYNYLVEKKSESEKVRQEKRRHFNLQENRRNFERFLLELTNEELPFEDEDPVIIEGCTPDMQLEFAGLEGVEDAGSDWENGVQLRFDFKPVDNAGNKGNEDS